MRERSGSLEGHPGPPRRHHSSAYEREGTSVGVAQRGGGFRGMDYGELQASESDPTGCSRT